MKLHEPLKVEWRSRTLARSKIQDFNRDRDSDRSDLVDDVLSREKTNAVIETVEEAEALAQELNHYIGEAGDGGRTWVNSSVDKSCRRVQKEIIAGMESRGFEADRPTATQVFFYPGDDAEADEEEHQEPEADEQPPLVDAGDVAPGDLVRTHNDSIYRVVSWPTEDDGDVIIRVVRASGAGRSETVYLSDCVRHADRLREEEINTPQPTPASEGSVEEAIRRSEEEGVRLDAVLPRGASIHLKSIPSGNTTRKYAYVNWRENGEHRSKYVGKASAYGLA